MLWLALSFPELALEVFATKHAEHTKPIVVLENNRVSLRNAAAKAANIAIGSSLATAHTIDTSLIHFHRDPHSEDKRLRTLADTLYRFSDHVSVQSPDCVLLEIGGSLKLFGSHKALSEQAIDVCAELGHAAVARCAQTPWAAIALARSQAPSSRQPSSQLADVPLHAAGLELAGITPKVIERFANMGIYTLGPLLKLPSTELGKRFGPALLRYLEQLVGNVGDPREAIVPAPDFAREIHLLQPINDKQALFNNPHSPMQTLARELQHWLIARQLGCERLEWHFACAHRTTPSGEPTGKRVPVHFAHGKQSQAEFLKVSELKLENVELPDEVLTVGLAAKRLGPWHSSSRNLFKIAPAANTDQRENQQLLDGRAAELVDELSARLGDGACRGVQDMNQHTPESAWIAVSARQLLQPPRTQSAVDVQTGKRPLWLLSPPRRVQLTELELVHGPERIQSQWWSTTTCRDYYIARHRDGAECWAFVDDHAQWYLHGYFA